MGAPHSSPTDPRIGCTRISAGLACRDLLAGDEDGRSKAFTLRGIKESPPYFHDGRLLTLEDTIEFFNLVLGLHLAQREKDDLLAYLLVL